MTDDCGAAHVLAEQQQGPPHRLLDNSVLDGHQGADDADGLGDVGHADWRTKTLSQTATARASDRVYASSAPLSPGARSGSQTFHSSKQILVGGLEGEMSFSMRARSTREAMISMERSAGRGAVTFWRCELWAVWM